jgi:Reverse transcriptase (RNA-dependent DNA polymerase)
MGYSKKMSSCGNQRDISGRVCQLIKTLYGLKQSGREWNKKLDNELKEKRFMNLKSDPCVYVWWHEQNFEVWVDDLLVITKDDQSMTNLKNELESVFELTNLGGPSKIVGIKITQTLDSITITQKQYILTILQSEGMQDTNPVSTPVDTNIKLEPNPEGSVGNWSNSFAMLIGKLQYLATATRPNIAFAVNQLAAYTANPSLIHYTAAKRILRYLKRTINLGLTYWDTPDSNIFYGYSDAVYANADGYRLTSGYVFFAGDAAITWGSRKQATIALSSTEAEYIALSESSHEIMWLRHLYGELGYIQKKPTLLLGDNDGLIAMACNPQFHKRSKHVDIRWHWVRDLVQDRLINIQDCCNPDQTADILTKALQKQKNTTSIWKS